MPRHVLVAVELSSHPANVVLKHALDLLRPGDVASFVHVVDPKMVRYGVDPSFSGKLINELTNRTIEQARERLAMLCEPYGIARADQHVLYGHVTKEIHEFAIRESCSEIMLGSHGYSGWHRILGSRASSILHGTPIDTWVFRIPPNTNSNAE